MQEQSGWIRMSSARRVTLDHPSIADRTGKGVVVAILDSGVHPSHPHVGAIEYAENVESPGGDTIDRLGHGTAVAAAIRDIAPGTTLIVGKIFDKTLATNAETLARGIDWAVAHGARIVNLSLGTANRAHEEFLRESVERARHPGGVLIVSALESDGVQWLPGSLPYVTGVLADPKLERHEFMRTERAFVAAPWPRSIPGVPRDKNLSGVSFAVANTTGLLARLTERGDGRGDLMVSLSVHVGP